MATGHRSVRKHRAVPNTISKRFRRKLRRTAPEKRFHLWLRCKRPRVWTRLNRLWMYRLLERICSIPPHATPFMALLTADRYAIKELWRLDAETHAR